MRASLPSFGAPLGSVEIVVSDYLPKEFTRAQVRFPKSKKRRIRKKWARDPRNWRTMEKPVALTLNGRLFVNRVAYETIQREVSA